MRYGSSDFTLLTVDGYNLLGAKVQSFAERREGVMERVDGLGDKIEQQGPTGLTKITIVQGASFFDDSANGMHMAFKDMPGVVRTMMYSFTAGKTVTTITGVYRESYAVIAAQGKLTRAAVTYQINGVPKDGGRVVQAADVHTATWTGTVVDLGAAVPGGGSIVQQVLTLTGGTLVGLIEHSDDGTTFVSLTTFPTVTAPTPPPSSQTQTVGAVKRYLRFTGTLAGASPTAQVVVVFTPT